MTRTRSTRRTLPSAPPAKPSTTTPDSEPLTRADFESAISVLERLSAFALASPGTVMHESADLRRSINRLELYRDWWTAAEEPGMAPRFQEPSSSPAAQARIEELEAKVQYWRGYSRRNEDRAKKSQRELDQIKTARRKR